MQRRRQAHALAFGAFLLLALPQAVAHGHGENEVDHISTGPVPTIEKHRSNSHFDGNETSVRIESYFAYPSDRGWIYAHIVLMTVAWFFALPIAVVLSIARSRSTWLAQFAFFGINALGLFVGLVYNNKTPDFYPHNLHHTLGWALSWVVFTQALVSFLSSRTIGQHSRRRDVDGDEDERGAFIPVSVEALAEHRRLHPSTINDYRFSGDSGHGTQRDTSTTRSHTSSPSVVHQNRSVNDFRHHGEAFDGDIEKGRPRRNPLSYLGSSVGHSLLKYLPSAFTSKLIRTGQLLSRMVDRIILPLGFVGWLTGVVTYGGIFRGNDVFNGLAHFVKGGIFFGYGLLTLGRWLGCFADLGWAWNVKPGQHVVGRRKAAAPSAEFVESFVMFLYGCTNVFLEHLAAWGGTWTAMDLEHVSISIMFFGGGLCGMLVESTKIRDLLNAPLLQSSNAQAVAAFRPDQDSKSEWSSPKTYRFSMNPVPALMILLLGLMMSSHHQSSMVSSMVHKQWGTLLVGFALARAVTYILSYLSPPTSLLPSRPPSELVSSFCLISGGIIFMASNRNTVNAMEYYDLDAMFVFTVTMGVTAFLMAWETVVIALKGWAVRRESS